LDRVGYLQRTCLLEVAAGSYSAEMINFAKYDG
jgi:hypothetical protein